MTTDQSQVYYIGASCTHLAFCDTPHVDHGMNRSEVRNQHGTGLVKGQTVQNPHANGRQCGRVGGEGILSAETNDPIAYAEVVWTDVCTHKRNDAGGFNAKQTDWEFNNSKCDQNILKFVR